MQSLQECPQTPCMQTFDNPDFDSVSSREWIVTNGIGGYASSGISGANTRRYHGLLIAAFSPPADRRVIVSKVEEKIRIKGEEILISTNQYPAAIYPDGFQKLKSFESFPFPCSVFASDKFSVSKTVFMIYGSNTTVIEYHNNGNSKFEMELTPLLVYRDYHHLFQESGEFEFSCQQEEAGKVKVTPRLGVAPAYIHFSKGKFISNPDWYHNFQYFQEKERGLDFQEDAKSVGQIICELKPGEKAYLIFSAEKTIPDGSPTEWKTHEELRLRSLDIEIQNEFIRDLAISGDQFIVWRLSSHSHTVIAGYHWFTDWGRDTMIAMRGLVIATGKKKIAESIFLTFLQYLDGGMIPNRFPDRGEEPEYNTIDATLWLFVALYDYYQKFKDLRFIESAMSSLSEIIASHYAGTRYHIHVTNEGLLFGGEEGVQLTWMDAKVDNYVMTPRIGCAVEINALWYNALNIFVEFGELTGYDITEIKKYVLQTKSAFQKYFINGKGYLNDVVVPGQYIDETIRPNQVYAISLPFSPLSAEESKSVLKTIEKHLYTHFGLRSLSEDHTSFKGIYTGDQWQRDHAYHQGTVWSYLWGEYAIAYLKVHHYSESAKKHIRNKSKSLEEHFYHHDGLFCISEIFDGDHPRAGKGCIQQAWSLGMTLKALLETEKA